MRTFRREWTPSEQNHAAICLDFIQATTPNQFSFLFDFVLSINLVSFTSLIDCFILLFMSNLLILFIVIVYVFRVSVTVPTGLAAFPQELFHTPRSWARKKFRNILSYTYMPSGGHFAAFEEPQLLVNDFREFVKKVEKLPKRDTQ